MYTYDSWSYKERDKSYLDAKAYISNFSKRNLFVTVSDNDLFKSISLGLIDNPILKVDIMGKILNGQFQYNFIKFFDGGYLLCMYKTLTQKNSDYDEWFDSYEESENYFKSNDFEVEWLEQ